MGEWKGLRGHLAGVTLRRHEIVGDRKSMGDASGTLALCHYGPELCVLGLLVAAKVHLPLEGTSAQVAREGLEPGVLARVCDEVGGLAEGFAADGALVGFFS